MNSLMIIIISAAIGIVIFLLLREFNCWYWKINQRIQLMEEQNELLKEVLKNKEYQKADNSENIANKESSKSVHKEIDLEKLKTLIEKEKNKNIFGKSSRSEIIDLIESHCESKNDCINLIDNYSIKYGSNLINDLKALSTSYEGIKQMLSVFITYEVVEKNHPHEIITN